jgi:hypothetical protein
MVAVQIIMAHEFSFRATLSPGEDLDLYEEVHQNCLFHCCGDDLRERAGGGPAVMQEDRQKLPDE